MEQSRLAVEDISQPIRSCINSGVPIGSLLSAEEKQRVNVLKRAVRHAGDTARLRTWLKVKLLVQIVQGVAHHMCGFAGGIFDGPNGLVEDAFASQLIITGRLAHTLL